MIFTVDKITEADILRAAEIELQSFSDPWSERSLFAELYNSGCIFLAAYNAKSYLIGYIIGRADENEGYIEKLAVDKSCRRCGVASALIERFILECGLVGHISLEVRMTNIPATVLYSHCGFTEAGVRKNLYDNPREDGMVMIYYPKENRN